MYNRNINFDSIVTTIMTISIVIIIFNINVLDTAIGFMPILSSIKTGSVILRSSPIVFSQLVISMLIQKILNKFRYETNYVNKLIKIMIINSVSVILSSYIIYKISMLFQEHFNIKLSVIGIVISIVIISVLVIFSFFYKTAREIVFEILLSIVTYLMTIKLIPDIDSFALMLLSIFVILFVLLLGIYFMIQAIK